MGKVRLKDIGEALGVSSVTVYNALSGNKGVSPNLRMRIVEKAEEMGYEPVFSAKKKEGESGEFRKVGVLIAENYLAQYSTYYWKMYQELSLAATEKRCYTTIEVLKKDVEKRTLALPEIVRNGSIEGLIIIGEIDKKYIRNLREKVLMPIIFLDFYDNEIAKDAVIADNFYGMYQMTELLFERGIEKIGFIGSIYATSSIMDRYCGFMKAVMEHKASVPGEWVIEDRDEAGQVGFELPRCLPEAFVCNCDLVAGMTVSKLQESQPSVRQNIGGSVWSYYLEEKCEIN